MKAKVVGLPVLAMHIAVAVAFSLMQGCTTGDSSVKWLNWPYSTPKDEPVVLPADDIALPAVTNLPVAAPVSAAGTKVYKVQKGDTLSSIASAHGTTWKTLADCNSLSNPNQLKVGQEIRLPGSASCTAPSKTPVSSRPVVSSIKQGTTYVIKKGDSLSSIAKRSGLTVNELKVANNLKNDSISAGKNLTIPKKGAVKSPVAKAAPAKAANPSPVKSPVSSVPAAALPAPAPLADAAPVVAPAAAATDAAPAVTPAPAVPAAAVPVAAAASAPVYEHVLYPGETLDDVARQYGSSQQEIMKLNNVTDPASVKPGTKLLVPIPE